jgi:hypothetical protein
MGPLSAAVAPFRAKGSPKDRDVDDVSQFKAAQLWAFKSVRLALLGRAVLARQVR